MPRPGPRRESVVVRILPTGRAQLEHLAIDRDLVDPILGPKLSELIRQLITRGAEADGIEIAL